MAKGTMLVIAPCLFSPYTVYRGATDRDLAAAMAVRGLLGQWGDLAVLTYPCPELVLLGFPRPPLSRDHYEELGMREVAEGIVGFLRRVVEEEAPERLIVMGVKGSPTCATHTTTVGSLGVPVRELVGRFRGLGKSERVQLSREISRKFRREARPGILMELLQGHLSGTFVEFDKGDPQGSIALLKALLGG